LRSAAGAIPECARCKNFSNFLLSLSLGVVSVVVLLVAPSAFFARLYYFLLRFGQREEAAAVECGAQTTYEIERVGACARWLSRLFELPFRSIYFDAAPAIFSIRGATAVPDSESLLLLSAHSEKQLLDTQRRILAFCAKIQKATFYWREREKLDLLLAALSV
jgi:hypothetical protein